MVTTIGKAVLYQMLGVQANHYTINMTSLPSSCRTCPWLEAALSNPSSSMISTCSRKCSICPHNHSDVIKYINEKNAYGSKPKESRNAILIFIYLHQFVKSNNGFISGISVHTIAETLGISVRTVKNCFNRLQTDGYIFMDSLGDGEYNIILQDYNTYFMKANEGGRGYIKLSTTTISSLYEIDSILVLRLILRQLLESDYQIESIKKYRDLRYSLPKYCKRNVIQKQLQKYTSLPYEVEMTAKVVSFRLKDKYNTELLTKQELKSNELYFEELFNTIDDIVIENDFTNLSNELRQFFFDENGLRIKQPIFLSHKNREKDIADLSHLAIKYSRQIVVQALSATYRNTMCKQNKLINDLGAYILSVINTYGSSSLAS